MTYDVVKKQLGREPVYMVELLVDRCTLTYGIAPCTASGPADEKCFNTRATCQDTPNYDRGDAADRKPYRFASVDLWQAQNQSSPFPEGDPPVFPTVLGISTAPTELTPAKGLGVRSQCSITLTDMTWTDVGVDPYLDERSVNFLEQGSFWGRWLARNPFYEGRLIRLYTGYLEADGSFDLDNFVQRLYQISRISGPNSAGTVTIEGQDILKAADAVKSQIPTATKATLDADFDDVVTTMTFDDPSAQVLASWNDTQPWMRIDDEVIELTEAPTLLGGDQYQIANITRAILPAFYVTQPDADDHDDGSTIQPCYLFENIRLDDLIFYLLNTVSGIDASFLPLAAWQLVIDSGLQNYLFSRLLIEPNGVKNLLEELTQHTILLWWDEREQIVRMDSILQRALTGPSFVDADFLANSSSQARDIKQRVSQVWIHYGTRSPLLDQSEWQTYGSTDVSIDSDAESPEEYGEVRVYRVFSQWMPLALQAVAQEVGSRLSLHYRDTATILAFKLDPKDDSAWTGDIVEVQTKLVQNDFGASPSQGYRILKVNENTSMSGPTYSYQLRSESIIDGRLGVITPDNDPDIPANPFPDYGAASDSLKSHYAFIGPNPPTVLFPDGGKLYLII